MTNNRMGKYGECGTYSPPKSCMPSSAKMRMKRKSRKRRDTIERIELSREMTKLRREFQYLKPQCRLQLERAT